MPDLPGAARGRTLTNGTWTLGSARRGELASLGAGYWVRSAPGLGSARRGGLALLGVSSLGRAAVLWLGEGALLSREISPGGPRGERPRPPGAPKTPES